MSLTRDQLRAARVLLHLQQTQLADIAKIGVATIRRFEGGKDIGHLYIDALRRAVVEAGAVLIDAGAGTGYPSGSVGVVLLPEGELPESTRARIATDQARDADGPESRDGTGGKSRDAPVELEAPGDQHRVEPASLGTSGDEQPEAQVGQGAGTEPTSTGAKPARQGRRVRRQGPV